LKILFNFLFRCLLERANAENANKQPKKSTQKDNENPEDIQIITEDKRVSNLL